MNDEIQAGFWWDVLLLTLAVAIAVLLFSLCVVTARAQGPDDLPITFHLEPWMLYVTPENVGWMTKAMNAEAGNQPPKARAGVGCVVYNRLLTGRWGDTIYDVFTAPRQFTSYQVASTPGLETSWAARVVALGVEATDVPSWIAQWQEDLAVAVLILNGDGLFNCRTLVGDALFFDHLPTGATWKTEDRLRAHLGALYFWGLDSRNERMEDR